MNKAERKPTSIKIDPDLLKAVQKACIDRGTTQSEAIEWGLRKWLGVDNPKPPSALADAGSGEVELLAGVLNFLRHNPDHQMVSMVRGLLEAAAKWKAKT